MTPPTQRRVTWAEVAEWLPDGEAEVAFDRDVAPTGMPATLYLRRVGEIFYGPWPEHLIALRVPGPVAIQLHELWAIDEEAPLTAHRHDVRVHNLSFSSSAPKGPCRCRVWLGLDRGWHEPPDERATMAKRGTALYTVVGGRVTLGRPW